MKKLIVLCLLLLTLGCGTIREQWARSLSAEGQGPNESTTLLYQYFKGLHQTSYREQLGSSSRTGRSIYLNGRYVGDVYGQGNGFADIHLYGPNHKELHE